MARMDVQLKIINCSRVQSSDIVVIVDDSDCKTGTEDSDEEATGPQRKADLLTKLKEALETLGTSQVHVQYSLFVLKKLSA